MSKTITKFPCSYCDFQPASPQTRAAHMRRAHPVEYAALKKNKSTKHVKKRHTLNLPDEVTGGVESLGNFSQVEAEPIVRFCPQCGLDLSAISKALSSVGLGSMLTARIMSRLERLKETT